MTNFLIGTAWTAFVAGVGLVAGVLFGARHIDSPDRRRLVSERDALLAERNRRLKPLREANARRSIEALERKNQAKARTDALHAELRELTEGLI